VARTIRTSDGPYSCQNLYHLRDYPNKSHGNHWKPPKNGSKPHYLYIKGYDRLKHTQSINPNLPYALGSRSNSALVTVPQPQSLHLFGWRHLEASWVACRFQGNTKIFPPRSGPSQEARSRFYRRFTKPSSPSRTDHRLHTDNTRARREERSSLHRVVDGPIAYHGWFVLPQRGSQDLIPREWDIGIIGVWPKSEPTISYCWDFNPKKLMVASQWCY
jgi:hypothetical protein